MPFATLPKPRLRPFVRAVVAALALSLLPAFTPHAPAPGRLGPLRDLTPQTLPFSQNWTNTGLLTTDDSWDGVPGLIGYRGDDLTTSTGTDPQTVLADGSGTPVDVNANQTNTNATTGGITEFELANPVVALQGSGTADAPHLVLTISTTGLRDVVVAYTLRDLDGSADDAVQAVALQYRVGTSGPYTNVPAGFVADATTGPNLATLVTPVSATLPAAANDQAVVQVRILTTNAAGSDEWVGVDDLSVTGSPLLRPPVLNEFVFNHTGSDTYEYLEVYGSPNTDYSAYTLLVLEGDFSGTATGLVDRAYPVGTTDANGYWWTGALSDQLENGTQTVLLVQGFTGTTGADLDTNDDGVLDVTPWTALRDAVAVHDGGASDLTYGAPVLTAAFDGGSIGVGGASRLPNGQDTNAAADWTRNDFDGFGLPGFAGTPAAGEARNTPGAANAPAVVGDAAPAVTATTPADGAVGVAVNASVEITFSEPVTAGAGAFTLECPAATPVAFALSGGPTTFTLDPAANLPYGTLCTVSVVAAAVTDQDANDPPDNPAADFSFSFTTAAAPAAASLLFNEILADPPAGADPNGDGTANTTSDEFVELVNVSGADLDVSGWTLSDAVGGRHTFPAGTVVKDQCSIVVFGGGTPAGPFGGGLVQAASGGQLGLNNSGDTVTLRDGGGAVRATYTYGSEGGDDQSITRSPDVTGSEPLVKHTTVATGVRYSPGTRTDGTRFSGCPAAVIQTLEIHEIQGGGLTSPVAGQTVRTVGNVVTVVGPEGFFMQTPTARADADAETSQGLYVFTGAAPAVSVGDEVTVEGQVVEFFNFTELTNSPSVTVTSSGNPLPAAVAFDAATPTPVPPVPATELERYESMRVAVANGSVSGPSQSFGSDPIAEAYVVARPGRAFREPGVAFPGLPGLPVWDANPEVFELDPDALGLPNQALNAGTAFSATGVLAFQFGGYELWPTQLSLTPDALPEPARAARPGEHTVGSLNLLRFYDDVNDPAISDAAENNTTTATFQARVGKFSRYIREVLGAPDILAVQEVENLNALQTLAGRLGADDPTLQYTAYLVEGNDVGGIDVGFLVRQTVQVSAVTQLGKNETLSLDGSLLNDRPPLLLEGTFAADGFPIAVLVVHNRSLGGIDDPGDGPRVRQKRLEQAQFVAGVVQSLQAANPDVRLVVTGDFNAYEFTDGYVDVVGQIKGDFDPADNLLSGPDLVDPNLTDQVLRLPPPERYSFIFRGTAQVLDHALTSQGLDPFVQGFTFARGNADAPEVFEDDFSTVLRASDHDGLVLYVGAPKLTATKTATLVLDADNDGRADAGDVIGYTVTVTNVGTPADVTFTDTLPAPLAYVPGSFAASSGAAVQEARGTLTASLGPVAAGTPVTLTFQARVPASVPAGAPTTVANQATLSGPLVGDFVTDDPTTPAPGDPATLALDAEATLAATKRVEMFSDLDGDGRLDVGDQLRYVIEVTNTGGREAAGVLLTDTPALGAIDPASVTVAPAGTAAVGGGTLTADLGGLAGGGGRAVVTFVLTLDAPAPAGLERLLNQAIATSSNAASVVSDDPATPAPDDATAFPLDNPARLVINEVDYDQPGPDTAEFVELYNAGTVPIDLGRYSLRLVNGSGGAVYQTLALPAQTLAPEAYFVVCADTGALPGCDLGGLGGLQNGAPDALALVLDGTLVVDALSYEGDVPGAVEGTGAGLEDDGSAPELGLSRLPDGADTDQNAADFSLRCTSPGARNLAVAADCDAADLELTKTVDEAQPQQGQTVTFTLALTNQGPRAVGGVVVADVLPAGLTFAGAGPAYDPATGVWSVGTLAVGQTATLALQARADAARRLVNRAEVTAADRRDPDSAPGDGQGDDFSEVVLDVRSGALAPLINEFVADHAGPDTYEFIEVYGAPGTDYAGFSVLAVEGDAGSNPGRIDAVFPVGTTDASGFWTTGFLSNALENGTLTLLLAEYFTGLPGDDLDADDDGRLDATPWQRLADAVAVDDGGAGDRTYAGAAVLARGYDGRSPTVGGASRLPNGADTDTAADWTRNDPDGFGLPGLAGTPDTGEAENTPGVANRRVAPALTATKAATLLTDRDGDGRPDAVKAVRYLVTITNAGSGAVDGVVFTDVLGAGLRLVPGSVVTSQGQPLPGGLRVEVGRLAPGAQATITFEADVAAPLPAGLTAVSNQGSVQAPGLAPVPTDDPATPAPGDATTTALPLADVSLAKTAGLPDAQGHVVFTLTLRNDGPAEATQVEVTDRLPPGLRFLGASPAATYDPGTGVWRVGTVPAGGTATLALTAEVLGQGPVGNAAEVTQLAEIDPDALPGDGQGDDFAEAVVRGGGVDLALSKTVDRPVVNVGETVVFTLTVTNESAQAATGVVVTERLPDGLTVTGSTPAGAFDPLTSRWNVGTVPGGGAATLRLSATLTRTGPVTNTAEITAADQGDPDSTPGNAVPGEDDQASATVAGEVADLVITKTVDREAVRTGEPVVFTITLRNDGPAEAVDVVVRDTPPEGLAVLRADGDAVGCQLQGTVVRCVFAALPAGATRTLRVTAAATAPGSYVNAVAVEAATPDPDAANNAAAATVRVQALPPEVPAPRFPVGVTVAAGNVTFGWRSAARATSYQLQIASDAAFTTLLTYRAGLADTTLTTPIPNGGAYFWRVKAVGPGGESAWSEAEGFQVATATGVEPVAGDAPTAFRLLGNYPNPFNPSTEIRFDVPETRFVRLGVYDLLGRELAVLVARPLAPGRYRFRWEAKDQPSGVYLYRLEAGSYVATRQMVLLK